jgi:hypothetical protein
VAANWRWSVLGAIALIGCAKGEGVGPSDNTGGSATGGAAGADASVAGGGGASGSGASAGAGGGLGGSAGSGGSPTGGSAGIGGATTGGSGGTGATGGSPTGGSGGTGATGGSPTGGSGGTGATGGSPTGGSGGGGTGGTGGGTGGSGGFGGCAVKSYDFTGCAADFTAAGNNTDWACGNPSSGPGSDHTGSGNAAWGTSLNGNSKNCADSTLTSQEIDLSSYSGQTVRLQFWHWYRFRACDPAGLLGLCNLPCTLDPSTYSGGLVEVHDGSGWKKATPIAGYSNSAIDCYYVNSDGGTTCSPCALDGQKGFAGSSGGWVPVEIDVSSYTHSKFRLRFHFASYASDPCHPATQGWYIDDVRIAKMTCP